MFFKANVTTITIIHITNKYGKTSLTTSLRLKLVASKFNSTVSPFILALIEYLPFLFY